MFVAFQRMGTQLGTEVYASGGHDDTSSFAEIFLGSSIRITEKALS